MYVCMYFCIYVRMYVCMHACMCVCMFACLLACLFLCFCVGCTTSLESNYHARYLCFPAPPLWGGLGVVCMYLRRLVGIGMYVRMYLRMYVCMYVM